MKKNPLVILLSIIFSGVLLTCSSETHESCEDSHDAITSEIIVNDPSDSIPKAKHYEDLNDFANTLDSLRNPYLVQKKIVVFPCEEDLTYLERINCVISQFQKAELPVHAGPTHEIPVQNKQPLIDSLFIAKCIADKQYHKEEERMYSYLNGKLLDSNNEYYLVLVAMEYSVGKSFLLITISAKTGEQIDIATLGAESADVRSIYGKLTDKSHFEIQNNELDYDEKTDQMYFKTQITRHFEITDKGIFVAYAKT